MNYHLLLMILCLSQVTKNNDCWFCFFVFLTLSGHLGIISSCDKKSRAGHVSRSLAQLHNNYWSCKLITSSAFEEKEKKCTYCIVWNCSAISSHSCRQCNIHSAYRGTGGLRTPQLLPSLLNPPTLGFRGRHYCKR